MGVGDIWGSVICPKCSNKQLRVYRYDADCRGNPASEGGVCETCSFAPKESELRKAFEILEHERANPLRKKPRALVKKDGYPTRYALETISSWPARDVVGLMKFVEGIWWPNPDYISMTVEGRYRLVTSGWSGNEEIIDAMQGNQMWWTLWWWSSRRGGAYEFRSGHDQV